MEFRINYINQFNWYAAAYDTTVSNRLCIEQLHRNPTTKFLQLSITYDKISINFDVTKHFDKLRQTLKVNSKVKLVKDPQEGGFKLVMGGGRDTSINLGEPELSAASVWHRFPYTGDLQECHNEWLTRYGF